MRLKSLGLMGAGLVSLLTIGMAIWGSTISGLGMFPIWFLPFGLLMVFFVPGYALTLAFLPHLDRFSVLLLSMGISISMSIMGGLVLHYTSWGLHPISWAIWLGCVSLLGCIIAIYRWSRLSKEAVARSIAPRWNWQAAVSFLLTSVLIIAAVIIARNSATQAGTAFTQLWAVPGTDEDGYAIQIGISNREFSTMQFELFVESQGATINQWTDIVLAPGETWTLSMPLMEKPKFPFTFLLYKTDAPDKVYRMVHLAPESFNRLVPSPGGR